LTAADHSRHALTGLPPGRMSACGLSQLEAYPWHISQLTPWMVSNESFVRLAGGSAGSLFVAWQARQVASSVTLYPAGRTRANASCIRFAEALILGSMFWNDRE
jgi:hypothetical protein